MVITKLNIMFIDVNEISGTIPSALANMKNLQSILIYSPTN